MTTARALNMATIGLTGAGGGRMAALCDVLLDVDAVETYLVQERHLPLYTACLCMRIEQEIFGGTAG